MVKRSPQGRAATISGLLLGFPKTCAPSEWLEQSIKPTSSAQAAEAARKLAPKRIRNRLRSIAPSSARGHTEPLMLLSGLETCASNWPEGQAVPKRHRPEKRGGRVFRGDRGVMGNEGMGEVRQARTKIPRKSIGMSGLGWHQSGPRMQSALVRIGVF